MRDSERDCCDEDGREDHENFLKNFWIALVCFCVIVSCVIMWASASLLRGQMNPTKIMPDPATESQDL